MAVNFLKDVFADAKTVALYFGNGFISILGIDKIKHTKSGISLHPFVFFQKMLGNLLSEGGDSIGVAAMRYITTAVGGRGVKKANCLFVLQEREVFVRTIQLPHMPAREIENAFKFELKRLLPVKLSEVKLSYKIYPVKGKFINVSILAVPTETLAKYNYSIKGYKPLFISASSALISLLKHSFEDIKDSDVYLAVYMDKNRALIVFFRGAVVLLSRDVVAVNGLASLKEEIDVSIDYLSKTLRMSVTVSKAYILDLETNRIDEKFSDSIGCEVLILDPVDLVAKQIMLKDVQDALGMFFTVAGINAYIDGAPVIDVAAAKLEQKKKKTKKQTYIGLGSIFYFLDKLDVKYVFLISFIFIAIGIGIWGLTYQKWAYVRQKYSRIVNKLPADVFPNPENVSIQQIEEKKNAFISEKEHIQRYLSFKEKRAMYKVLDFLVNDLPGNMWVSFPITIDFDLKTGRFLMKFVGNVFLGDMDAELKAVDDLLSKIRKKMPGYFNNIDVLYFKRVKSDGYEYLSFGVRCY